MDGNVINIIKKTVSGIFSVKSDPDNEPPPKDDVASIYDGPTKDEIIADLNSKFDQASEDRIPYELQWQMNTNFELGNQYCDINPFTQDMLQIEKAYWYQEREVFDHIAPIIETREAKLSRVHPSMTVRPATNNFNDISAAKVSTAVVKATQRKVNMLAKLSEATGWSELTGTVFYKSTWDHSAGKVIGIVNGKAISEGDIHLYVCPPYEIFPESPFASMEGQRWIFHQKAYHEDDVEDLWGKRITGKDIEVYSLGQTTVGTGGLGYSVTVPSVQPTFKKSQVMVREYYERPSRRYPEGRMIIYAEDELLYYGSLPYQNGEDKKREFPLTKQVCINNPGCFWGISIIERLIPIQRRYNAVKNRKQEYLNRITLGVIDVEEGAYEAGVLEEGMAPGGILTRNRTFPPAASIDFGNANLQDFVREEDNLLNEFILISGVSEISRSSQAPTGVNSGIGIELLNEQDDTRLSLTALHTRLAVVDQSKAWIRLYRQFVIGPRMDRLVGEGSEILVAEWNKNDLTSDDIIPDTENELIQTPAQRKQQVYDMLGQGLFNDPDTGRLTKRALTKIYEMLEMGNWESGLGIDDLHIKRAQRENIFLERGEAPEIREYDGDAIHIEEHIRYMLSGDYEELLIKKPEMATELDNHVKQHEQSMMFKAQKDIMQQQALQPAMPPGTPGQQQTA